MRTATSPTPWRAGISRRIITPTCATELAGLGYYLGRTAERVRDHLTATALVITDEHGRSAALLALDVMYGSSALTRKIRDAVAAATDISPGSICINCSHTHNAPTAEFTRGIGELDPNYVEFVARQSLEACVQAWHSRRPACLSTGSSRAEGVAFNRTRENGPVDTLVNVLRIDSPDGTPFAIAVNYNCHLNAHLDLDFRAVSRDWSGEMVDALEKNFPGATAMYLQGSCGDVMVAPTHCSTERRFEVGQVVTTAAVKAIQHSSQVAGSDLKVVTRTAKLPTRRWTQDEIAVFRDEGLHRLKTGDLNGWSDGFAKYIVTYPARLPLRYGGSTEKAVAAVARFALEWSEAALLDLESRPETLETEVLAIRLGEVFLVANAAELYTSLALDLRNRWDGKPLFILGYSNGAIGYLPDEHDIGLHSYAADQSPKFTGQFPFTAESGHAMVRELLAALSDAR